MTSGSASRKAREAAGSVAVRLVDGEAVYAPVSWNLTEHQAGVLSSLRAIGQDLAECQRQQADAIAHARELGVSWHRIGWALEVTGEAVRQRWGGEPSESSPPGRPSG